MRVQWMALPLFMHFYAKIEDLQWRQRKGPKCGQTENRKCPQLGFSRKVLGFWLKNALMIVMKFGGTSVGNAERIAKVASLVKSRLKEKPIVVVSAVGGVTDLLIQTAEKTVEGTNPGPALKRFAEIHQAIFENLNIDNSFFEPFFQELSNVYEGISLLKEFTPRTRDLISSFGERISARITAACLEKQGVKSQAFDAWDAGFITTSEFSHAKLLAESPEKIKKILTGFNGVPVVTGFIGKDAAGNITTLGRGGSDLSASLIGAAVDAEAIEIWTDVSGIMTADPRLVPEARSIPFVTFQEAAELSAFGAKVLHPKTIEPAVAKNIPVLVKNTFEPEHPGTVIVAKHEAEQGLKAISLKKKIVRLNIYSTGMLEAHGFLARVFTILEQCGISVDVVATSEVNVSLTLDNIEGLDRAKAALSEFAEVTVEKNSAIVAIVGEGLRETRGLAGKAFSILGEAGINIEMISQGASQINLTFIIASQDAEKAVKLLHQTFFEKKLSSV